MLITALLAAGAVYSAPQSNTRINPTTPPVLPTRYTVGLVDGAALDPFYRRLLTYMATSPHPQTNSIYANVTFIHAIIANMSPDVVARVEQDDAVAYVEPDAVLHVY